MSGSANRSRRLGDIGPNAPANWSWGVGEREPHVLLMLFATPERIDDLEREARDAVERNGLAAIETLHTSQMGDVEPFGFVDGVSQPTFDWDRTRTPGTKADRAYTNIIALGEILLGYSNEYGFPAESPKLAPSERNAQLLPPGTGVCMISDATAPISSFARWRRMSGASGAGSPKPPRTLGQTHSRSPNQWSAGA